MLFEARNLLSASIPQTKGDFSMPCAIAPCRLLCQDKKNHLSFSGISTTIRAICNQLCFLMPANYLPLS